MSISEGLDLRPYQLTALDDMRAQVRAGRKRIVLVMPTGGGKTVVAAALIKAAVARGSRCLFLAHRRELIDQTLDKLARFGVPAGVIMAQDPRRDDYLPVQVASVQTLVRRLERKPAANIVVVDECHHATSATYKKIVGAYQDATVIGLTATPWRTDKFGLADIFETSVLATTPGELIVGGALVPYDVFGYDAPDLHEVKITAGEYNQKDLALACNTKILVGSVVREYLAHARGRRAILFPVNIAHSQALAAEFRAANIVAEHIDCNTPKDIRNAAMRRFRGGDLIVLSSVGVLTEGFDAPAAEVCILARPTQSLSLHLQMIGRVLRPSPETGKRTALIHDHAGNVLRHGFPDDERDYAITATPDRVIAKHTCPACFVIVNRTNAGHCPKCGAPIAIPETRAPSGGQGDHETVDGRRISRAEIEAMRGKRTTLGLSRELTDRQLARAATATREEKVGEYLRLLAIAERKGFKPGFVSHQYRETFGVWPRFTDEEVQNGTPSERPFFPLAPRKTEAA